MPVYLLALAVVEVTHGWNAWLAFFILHVLIYPASNGYNSYFDKDEESIGGLKSPPKTTHELYYYAIGMDVLGIVLGLFISLEFSILIFIYGMVSKAYSHPSVRLKRRPILGWLAAGIFQGYFTFLLSYIAIADVSLAQTGCWRVQVAGMLSSLLLLGSYPMTQIYQHGEDERRGDLTISRMLGVIGTFHFTAGTFLISGGGFFLYFYQFFGVTQALVFSASLFPVLVFFLWWYLRTQSDAAMANYQNTMRLNFISSVGLNMYFIYLWLS